MQLFLISTKRRFNNGRLSSSNTGQFVAQRTHDSAFKKEIPKLTMLIEDNKGVCPGCRKKVTYRTKRVECEA